MAYIFFIWRYETKTELDENTSKEVKDLSAYLKKKGITATDSEIVMAAIKLARQLGAGNWSFVCELKERWNDNKNMG